MGLCFAKSVWIFTYFAPPSPDEMSEMGYLSTLCMKWRCLSVSFIYFLWVYLVSFTRSGQCHYFSQSRVWGEYLMWSVLYAHDRPCVLDCYRRLHIPAGPTLPIAARNSDERALLSDFCVYCILVCQEIGDDWKLTSGGVSSSASGQRDTHRILSTQPSFGYHVTATLQTVVWVIESTQQGYSKSDLRHAGVIAYGIWDINRFSDIRHEIRSRLLGIWSDTHQVLGYLVWFADILIYQVWGTRRLWDIIREIRNRKLGLMFATSSWISTLRYGAVSCISSVIYTDILWYHVWNRKRLLDITSEIDVRSDIKPYSCILLLFYCNWVFTRWQ
jgi:hypothetical protein